MESSRCIIYSQCSETFSAGAKDLTLLSLLLVHSVDELSFLFHNECEPTEREAMLFAAEQLQSILRQPLFTERDRLRGNWHGLANPRAASTHSFNRLTVPVRGSCLRTVYLTHVSPAISIPVGSLRRQLPNRKIYQQGAPSIWHGRMVRMVSRQPTST